MSKITALFSVDNMYDQPSHNLVCWWTKKPSVETLCTVLTGHPLENAGDDIVDVVNVWQGKDVDFPNETSYRLEEVDEGVKL